MNKNKRLILTLILCVAMTFTCVACHNNKTTSDSNSKAEKETVLENNSKSVTAEESSEGTYTGNGDEVIASGSGSASTESSVTASGDDYCEESKSENELPEDPL